MSNTVIEQGVSIQPLGSWREFGDFIGESHANSPAFLYRGEADATWKIDSTLDRLEARFPTTRNYWGMRREYFDCPPVPRDVHLEAFKEAVRGKRGPTPSELSEDEWWALAQHHGLATPLIDWTYSPFVALFFAFEEFGYIHWQTRTFREPEERAVHVVGFHLIGERGTEEHPAPAVFSPRREVSYRLNSQSGVFMRMPPGSDLESSIRGRYSSETSGSNPHPLQVLTKITIPNKERTECLKYLNKMNINRMSLFPDLDGAAKYINSLWELDFDTALGALPSGTSQNRG